MWNPLQELVVMWSSRVRWVSRTHRLHERVQSEASQPPTRFCSANHLSTSPNLLIGVCESFWDRLRTMVYPDASDFDRTNRRKDIFAELERMSRYGSVRQVIGKGSTIPCEKSKKGEPGSRATQELPREIFTQYPKNTPHRSTPTHIRGMERNDFF